MIRDMMVQCVERRFGSERALHRVQWLTDNGSVFAAQKTVDIAIALNLEPCLTPVEIPESNGMAEAFVKTFKRDYVCLAAIRDARTAPAMIESWIEDTRIPDWDIVHRESISPPNLNPPRARSNGVNSSIHPAFRTIQVQALTALGINGLERQWARLSV